MFWADRYEARTPQSEKKTLDDITWKHGLILGFMQCLALVPGVSRSGATIVGSMLMRVEKKAAAEFSFFLAVPTMFAASAKSFWDTYTDHPEVINRDNMITLLVGSLVAFVVAMMAIKFFIGFLKKYGFRIWGVYRIVVGLIMLGLIWRGII